MVVTMELHSDIIECRVMRHNSYGHPQQDMVRYLNRLGNVKRTDELGDIEIRL